MFFTYERQVFFDFGFERFSPNPRKGDVFGTLRAYGMYDEGEDGVPQGKIRVGLLK